MGFECGFKTMHGDDLIYLGRFSKALDEILVDMGTIENAYITTDNGQTIENDEYEFVIDTYKFEIFRSYIFIFRNYFGKLSKREMIEICNYLQGEAEEQPVALTTDLEKMIKDVLYTMELKVEDLYSLLLLMHFINFVISDHSLIEKVIYWRSW